MEKDEGGKDLNAALLSILSSGGFDLGITFMVLCDEMVRDSREGWFQFLCLFFVERESGWLERRGSKYSRGKGEQMKESRENIRDEPR